MRFLLFTCLGLAACGQTRPGLGDGGYVTVPNLTARHLASCDDAACGAGLALPIGGDHCAAWLPCRKYDVAQPRCMYLHNLEHGHAVLAYNCPQGCPDLVAKLEREFDGRQASTQLRRIIVTPDPTLPAKLMIAVWGHGWAGEGWDDEAAREVLKFQDIDAPESGLGCDP